MFTFLYYIMLRKSLFCTFSLHGEVSSPFVWSGLVTNLQGRASLECFSLHWWSTLFSLLRSFIFWIFLSVFGFRYRPIFLWSPSFSEGFLWYFLVRQRDLPQGNLFGPSQMPLMRIKRPFAFPHLVSSLIGIALIRILGWWMTDSNLWLGQTE